MTLEAGGKVDGMVAIAINLRHVTSGRGYWYEHEGVPREFKPSTDLNDAFMAAAEANLFWTAKLGRERDGWAMMGYSVDDRESYRKTDPQPTAALAICAAILAE